MDDMYTYTMYLLCSVRVWPSSIPPIPSMPKGPLPRSTYWVMIHIISPGLQLLEVSTEHIHGMEHHHSAHASLQSHNRWAVASIGAGEEANATSFQFSAANGYSRRNVCCCVAEEQFDAMPLQLCHLKIDHYGINIGPETGPRLRRYVV